MREQLTQLKAENADIKRQLLTIQEHHKIEQARLETRLQALQEERNHLRRQLDHFVEVQKQDADVRAQRAACHLSNRLQ